MSFFSLCYALLRTLKRGRLRGLSFLKEALVSFDTQLRTARTKAFVRDGLYSSPTQVNQQRIYSRLLLMRHVSVLLPEEEYTPHWPGR